MVFTTTPNTTGENGDKKQNTLPYTLQSKVVEVCLVVFRDNICCTAILLCVPKLAVSYLLPFAVFKEEINKRFISKHDSNISFLS